MSHLVSYKVRICKLTTNRILNRGTKNMILVAWKWNRLFEKAENEGSE